MQGQALHRHKAFTCIIGIQTLTRPDLSIEEKSIGPPKPIAQIFD